MRNLLLFTLLFTHQLFSQDIIFPQEDIYYIHRMENIKISIDNDSLKFVNHVSENVKYNNGNKLFFAKEKIPYNNFNKVQDIEAYTFLPEQQKKIKVDHFETKDEITGSTFYSEDRSINFVFPAVKAGAETTLEYIEIADDPYFMTGAFTFETIAPMKKALLSVEFDNNISVAFKEFNFQGKDISFTKTKKANTTVYTWEAKNTGKLKATSNNLTPLKYVPHVVIYINNYSINGKNISVLNNLDDLYSLYASWANQVDNTNLETVFSTAESLTKDLKTEHEKAKAIFNWVQDNISYIAMGDGYNGFIPDGARSVYDKRYGDCKGMSNLLFEMLNHVGITAYRTWIGSRNKPYSYEEIPTLIVDDHMITSVIIDNKIIFLDATDSYVPYGMPSDFILNKEALIGMSDTSYKIVVVQTPEANASKTIITTNMTVSEDGTVNASESRKMTGYEMSNFITNYKYKKDDKTTEEYLNLKYKIGNNKTTYSNINLSTLSSKKDSLTVSYDLKIKNYTKQIGAKIFINMNIEKPLINDIIDPEVQVYGKKINHKCTRTYNTELTIPNGYTVNKLPDDYTLQYKDFSYKISYKMAEGKIILSKTISINTIAIEEPEYETYNEFIRGLIKSYKKNITLEKTL